MIHVAQVYYKKVNSSRSLYPLCHQVDPMCNTKVSSSPKDTFPKAQQLPLYALHKFILIVIHISFVI